MGRKIISNIPFFQYIPALFPYGLIGLRNIILQSKFILDNNGVQHIFYLNVYQSKSDLTGFLGLY